MERTIGQFIRFDSIPAGRDPGDPGSGAADRFATFSGELARELAPRNLLERVLVDRVILSAWAMQVIAEQEIGAIGNPRSHGHFDHLLAGRDAVPGPGQVDLSPQGIALVADCLGKTLELFHRLRATSLVAASQPAPAATGVSSDSDSDGDFDRDGEFDSDSAFVDDHQADYSNEWPVIPRGRGVEDQPDGDPGDWDRSIRGEAPLAGRWQDRLSFDLNVSEDSPVIKGTWVTVSQVVSLIVDGWSWSDILRAHPELTEDDIRTCLTYTVAEEEGGL